MGSAIFSIGALTISEVKAVIISVYALRLRQADNSDTTTFLSATAIIVAILTLSALILDIIIRVKSLPASASHIYTVILFINLALFASMAIASFVLIDRYRDNEAISDGTRNEAKVVAILSLTSIVTTIIAIWAHGHYRKGRYDQEDALRRNSWQMAKDQQLQDIVANEAPYQEYLEIRRGRQQEQLLEQQQIARTVIATGTPLTAEMGKVEALEPTPEQVESVKAGILTSEEREALLQEILAKKEAQAQQLQQGQQLTQQQVQAERQELAQVSARDAQRQIEAEIAQIKTKIGTPAGQGQIGRQIEEAKLTLQQLAAENKLSPAQVQSYQLQLEQETAEIRSLQDKRLGYN